MAVVKNKIKWKPMCADDDEFENTEIKIFNKIISSLLFL